MWNHFLDTLLCVLFSIWVFQIVSIGQLFMCKKYRLVADTVVYESAKQLVGCAATEIPTLDTDWVALARCVDSVNVYSVSTARVPWSARASIAFVVKMLNRNAIFVVENKYKPLNPISKALVLIHECTHLVLDTEDYAYTWQPKFLDLSQKQHLNNADSFVQLIGDQCVIVS